MYNFNIIRKTPQERTRPMPNAMRCLTFFSLLISLNACTQPVNLPPAIDTEYDPGATCLVLDTHPKADFRIQCQTGATFYVSFKEKGSEAKIDLKDRAFTVTLTDGEKTYTLDQFRLYETGTKQLDTKTLWFTEMDLSSAPMQITADLAGYQKVTKTVERFSTENKAGIPELVIELEPVAGT